MTGFLSIVGAVTVGLASLAAFAMVCVLAWGYAQAVGGYLRAKRIAGRYCVKLWKEPKPPLFAVRMIHWQAWHTRDWRLGGLVVPWTFTRPIERERVAE